MKDNPQNASHLSVLRENRMMKRVCRKVSLQEICSSLLQVLRHAAHVEKIFRGSDIGDGNIVGEEQVGDQDKVHVGSVGWDKHLWQETGGHSCC